MNVADDGGATPGLARASPEQLIVADPKVSVTTLSAVYGLPVTVERTDSGRRVRLPSLRTQSTATITSDAFTTA